MRFLRTNTAVIVTVGPFYDKTDGVTIETALTITNERITLTADTDDGSAPTNILDNVTGATSGTSNDLNYITGNDAGMMQLELSAANVNRLGRMFLSITDAANHVPVFHEFMVMPALVYDTFFAASGGATFPAGTLASTTNITAGTVTTATNVTTVNGLAANVITAAATAADFTTEIQSGLATAAALATVDGIVDDILLDTAEIGAAGAGLTAINLPNQTMDIVGNITGNLSGSVGSVTGAVGSVTAMTTANVIQISGDSTAADNLETMLDDTAGAVPWQGIIDQGTAQSATSTTLVLRSAAAFADDQIIGATILITGGSAGVGQARSITDYVSSTDTATVETWTTTPTGTITYKIFGTPAASGAAGLDAAGVRAAVGLASANLDTQLAAIESQTDDIGTAGAGLTAIPWNASWDAEVQSEAADALNAYDPPTNTEMEARTLVAANYATAANLATVDTVVDNLNLGIIYGAAATGTLSTTQATSNLTGYANDQLIGRVITFLTGNAEGESTDITDYASASGLLTFTALTTAPGNGDTFKIT